MNDTTKEWRKNGWRIVADKSEVYPDDPGNGTPLMLYAPDNKNTATLNCALDTGECDELTIPPAILRWMESVDEEANTWVFGLDPFFAAGEQA